MDELLLKYMREISHVPKLTEQEMNVLFKHKDDPEVFKQLVECNIRLVFQTILKYRSIKDEEFSDLVSEGIIGLKIAISKFEPNRGFKFSTYCFFWVRKYIFLYLDACTKENGHSTLNNLVYCIEDSPSNDLSVIFKYTTAKESLLVRLHYGIIQKNSLSKKVCKYLKISYNADITPILNKIKLLQTAIV